MIDTVIPKQEPDSPVYTYLNSLIPPIIQDEIKDTIDQTPDTPLTEKSKKGDSLSIIIQEAEDSINEKDFVKAKALFQTVAQLSSLNQG